jgi:type III pantothenate kinase
MMNGKTGGGAKGGVEKLLMADIGNTNIVVGLYRDGEPAGRWRLTSRQPQTSDEFWVALNELFRADGLDISRISRAVVASVVPSLTRSMARMVRERLDQEPLIVDYRVKTGLIVSYHNPAVIGADRLTNAAGAYALYGGPTIVVDLGTATTWDVITSEAEYLGGAIAPGLETSASYLFEKAARLKVIELDNPGPAVGRTTEESMKAGIVYGAAGQIDRLCNMIDRERGEKHKVVATGGLAEVVAPHSERIEKVEPWLTLRGMYEIHRLNR